MWAVAPWVKALHVVAVISWMAGLLYLPRLFVHHVEKAPTNPAIHPVFVEMERKLLRLIMNPAMIVAWGAGLFMAVTPGLVDWGSVWPWVKAAAVIAMTWFHHAAGRWRKELAEERFDRSGRFFRLANEVPTVLMLIIVAMVIARPF